MAQRLGLPELLCQHVQLGKVPDAANPDRKAMTAIREDRDRLGGPLFERALAIREGALGPDHPDTAASLINAAGLLNDQGELAAARAFFERALTISEQALGLPH